MESVGCADCDEIRYPLVPAVDRVDGVVDRALDDREMNDRDRWRELQPWRGGSRSVDERDCGPLVPDAHCILFARVSRRRMQGGGEQSDGEKRADPPLCTRLSHATA